MTGCRTGAEHKWGLPSMPRVDAVWLHPAYQTSYRWLEELERDRPFCRHQLRHLLDVARIMWIGNLEKGLGLDREVVYATALLHDVGKPVQYTMGAPHEEVGARLADGILQAIWAHRRFDADAEPLARLLYQADKASRPCFACPAEVRRACSWSDAKKNLGVSV